MEGNKVKYPLSEEKGLILVKCGYGGFESNFYVVDLKAEKMCKTPFSILLNDAVQCESVLLGSFLYNIGGRSCVDPELDDDFLNSGHHIHLRASCLEFSKSHLLSLLNNDCESPLNLIRWKEAPPLDQDLGALRCSSLGDKIYALGVLWPMSCIGYEFTPEIGEWKPLPQPPSDLELKRGCISPHLIPDQENNRLLVHFSSVSALYAYCPSQRRWDCLDSCFPDWFCASTLVDGVLYAHSRELPDCIVAYDVAKNSWLKVVYSSPLPWEFVMCEFTDMLDLGNGILCLAHDLPTFERVKYPTHQRVKLLHCNLQFVKFSVDRTSETEVLVTPGPIRCFPFDECVNALRFFTL